MRENVFWLAVALVGLFGGTMHFCVEPVILKGRAWDAIVGAALLGNLVMLFVNAVEVLDERARRRRAR
jgi:uncharacterized integral membrane protein